MKYSFYLDNKDISRVKIDCNKLILGNPGIGGSEYEVLLISTQLKRMYPSLDIHLFSTDVSMIENSSIGISETISMKMAVQSAIDKGIEVIIVIYNNETLDLLKEYSYKINIIVWAQSFITYEGAEILSDNESVVRVVCVGKQEYDCYIDHRIIEKCLTIFNCVPFTSNLKVNRRNDVTYMGSLTRAKGFHVLAKHWKYILKHKPDAHLNVIGSGQLYKKTSKLGKYNIADENYEGEFIKYLLDENGEIIESVKFLGVLGIEKNEVIKQSKVGVPNPSGRSETFCIAAVEMQALGLPVVSINKYSLPDVLNKNHTGILYNRKRDLGKYVVRLLENDELNQKLSDQCCDFVKDKFSLEAILPEWSKLFEEVTDYNKPTQYIKPNDNYMNLNKWVRILNRKLIVNLNMHKLPPLLYWEGTFFRIKMKIRNSKIGDLIMQNRKKKWFG